MKATLHPQLLWALAISGAILCVHARGFADPGLRDVGGSSLQPPAIVTLTPLNNVVPERDPFVASVDESAPPDKQADFNGLVSASGSASLNNAADAHADGRNGLHLRAVVLGSRRYALVADGSTSQIVTLGSVLAGSSVTDISLNGITLANGARFIPEESTK